VPEDLQIFNIKTRLLNSVQIIVFIFKPFDG